MWEDEQSHWVTSTVSYTAGSCFLTGHMGMGIEPPFSLKHTRSTWLWRQVGEEGVLLASASGVSQQCTVVAEK